MGGRCGMNHQRFRITYIGQVTQKLYPFDELYPRLLPPVDAKGKQTAGPFRQISLCKFVIGTVFQASILYPGNSRMTLQIIRYCQRIGTMPVHPQRQGFKPL